MTAWPGEHEAMIILRNLLTDAARGFDSIDVSREGMLTAGLISACAVLQLDDEHSITAAKRDGTRNLRLLRGEALSIAFQTADRTARSRHHAGQQFAGIVWAIIRHMLEAQELLERSNSAGAAECAEMASAIVETLSTKIDGYVVAYSTATAEELAAAGLLGAASVIDSSIPTGRHVGIRRRARLLVRFPRLIPAVSAVLWSTASLAILAVWPEPSGFWSWVRWLASALPLLFAIPAWRDTLFSSNERISQLNRGGRRSGPLDIGSARNRGTDAD